MNDITNRRDLPALDNSSRTITANEFAFLWAKLSAVYPRQEINVQTAEIYFEYLSAYSKDEVSDAISGVVTNSKWFPTVAEIIAEMKGEHQCPHVFIAASLRRQMADIHSRRQMLDDSEKYANQRFKEISANCAELENRSIELYKRDREFLEQSGLADARAKLDAINAEIAQQEHVLALLRRKVKLLDQARILQGEET